MISREKLDYIEDIIASNAMYTFAESQIEESCLALMALGVTDEELQEYGIQDIYYGFIENEQD